MDPQLMTRVGDGQDSATREEVQSRFQNGAPAFYPRNRRITKEAEYSCGARRNKSGPIAAMLAPAASSRFVTQLPEQIAGNAGKLRLFLAGHALLPGEDP